MIHRIEPGWVHVNDALSQQERRQRRRLRKIREPLPETERAPRPGGVDEEEKVTIDVVA